jgi:hypothetical protein
MAKTQKRASLAPISKAAIAHASSALEALPARPKSNWSLREAVSLLQDSIMDALNKGYSYPEVSKMLALKGVEISASSLKSYLSAAKRKKSKAIGKGKKAAQKVAPKAKASNSKVVSLESKKAAKKAAPQKKEVAAAKPAAAKKLDRQAKAAAPVKTAAKAKATASARAAIAPKAVAPKAVAPKAVAPKAVAPKATVSKAAPKAAVAKAAPKAKASKAAPKAVAPKAKAAKTAAKASARGRKK